MTAAGGVKGGLEQVADAHYTTELGLFNLEINLDPLVGKAVTLQGSFSHTYNTWERVLGLMGSGQLNLDPVIGGEYPLSDWHGAFEHMEAGRNVKSVLVL